MEESSRVRNFAPDKQTDRMGKYILADNQDLTRFAIERLIRQHEDNVLYRAVDRAGLVQLLKEHEDAVVILDYTLFDFADEQQLLIIGERFQTTQWILISEELTSSFLRTIIYSSQQFSIVFKDDTLKDIRDSLTAAADHRRFVSQRVMEVILAQHQKEEQSDVLTATEIDIVKAIARGKTTKEIAEERFSSVHTITTHRKNIFRKLGINTAHEVIKYAIRSGWVDPSEFYI